MDGETWCGFNAPGQESVRMGLSPGAADHYSAQRERQWVDITGLEPGPAQMRAQANPLSGRLERRLRGRRVVRRLRSRRVAVGPARVALGRLAPGH